MKCLKGLKRAIWFFGHGTHSADPVQKSQGNYFIAQFLWLSDSFFIIQ